MSDKKQMQLLIDEFDRFGFYLDEKLDRDIEENRKGAFKLLFTDENGNPLNDVKVKITQKTHEFKFGCNTFFLDQFEDEERRVLYREKFKKLCRSIHKQHEANTDCQNRCNHHQG